MQFALQSVAFYASYSRKTMGDLSKPTQVRGLNIKNILKIMLSQSVLFQLNFPKYGNRYIRDCFGEKIQWYIEL